MKPLSLMLLSDVHQMPSKWKAAKHHCVKLKPDVIAIAGDLMPKTGRIEQQLQKFDHVIPKYAEKIKAAGIELVMMLGNDDNILLEERMVQGDKDGLWHYVGNRVKKVCGYEFVGYPYVPDYPFGYKDWCRKDFESSHGVNSYQIQDAVIISKDNKMMRIGVNGNMQGYKKHLDSLDSIETGLNKLASQVEDMSSSIWLIHAPPANLKLDVCATMEEVGSQAVYQFLEQHQPLISLHGHIHESPEMTGIWWKQLNVTTVIQAGQVTPELFFVTMDVDGKKISNMKHSYYGDA